MRMSGPECSLDSQRTIFRPRQRNRDVTSLITSTWGFLHDPHRDVDVDEVFAVFMDEPHTYTREKMAEVYCHGGLAAQRQVLTAALQARRQNGRTGRVHQKGLS